MLSLLRMIKGVGAQGREPLRIINYLRAQAGSEKKNKLNTIKIIEFDKNKLEEKEKVKIMEKKGIKNMKIRFFN